MNNKIIYENKVIVISFLKNVSKTKNDIIETKQITPFCSLIMNNINKVINPIKYFFSFIMKKKLKIIKTKIKISRRDNEEYNIIVGVNNNIIFNKLLILIL